MDMVISVTKTLVILAILSLLLELILPRGSTQKYAKFVMGLLVLLVVINPIIQLAGGETPAVADFDETAAAVSSTAEIIEKGQCLRQSLTAETVSEYEVKIADEIKKSLSDLEGVQSVEIAINEDENGEYSVDVIVLLSQKMKNDLGGITKIRNIAEDLLVNEYGLSAENFNVSVSCLSDVNGGDSR